VIILREDLERIFRALVDAYKRRPWLMAALTVGWAALWLNLAGVI
jgi:uncharacterized protein YndB with AHSA1/START domain